MESMIGQTLGHYQLIEQIGKGGMATVYKAFQPGLNRYVAIKVLPAYFAHEPGFAERFVREAQAIAQLDHPHILPVYDFGKQDDISYIVMKYVPAGTLREKLGRPMAPVETTSIIDQIAGALDAAHKRGILHRDVKPGNILIDDEGRTYLSDFGLAKMVESSVQLTGSGVGVGTPAYMSPEQGQGLPVDARTDVYALGVILFEMLTGHVPYEAETPMAVVIKHITDPIPMPRRINPNIPAAVEQVLLKALAKNRDDRFASAGTMAAALRQAVANLDPHVAAAPIPTDVEATILHPGGVPAAPPRYPQPPSYIPPPAPSSIPAQPAPGRKNTWLFLSLAVMGLALVGGICVLAGWLYFKGPAAAPLPTAVSAQAVPLPASTPTPILATPAPTHSPTAIPSTVQPADIPVTMATDILLPTPVPPSPTLTFLPTEPSPTMPATSTASATPTFTPTATFTPAPTFTPTPTFTPPPPIWPDTGLRPTGRFGDIWAALDGGQGELGYPVAQPVGERLCARENFERGYMLWVDSPQDPDIVWAIVRTSLADTTGQKSYKFTDTWPGQPEYWCDAAAARAPIGPKRGFGMLWCIYDDLRADIGQALEAEIGGDAYPRCEAQLFQGGAIAHNPFDSAYWVFINNGGWYRFGE
jgi:hypothetical protein